MSAEPTCAVPGDRSTAAERRWCHVKRFIERWTADREFRDKVALSPRATLLQYGLAADPEDVRPLWDGSLMTKRLDGTLDENDLPEGLRDYRREIRSLVRWREEIRAAAIPTHPRWRAWRERQIARAGGEIGSVWTKRVVFSTACYELSKGCSGGCWFCGLAAPRLSACFHRTPENARLYRAILGVMAELCGPAGLGVHFLYWATDPFDNPDYEGYCEDLFEMTGRYPPVTTALALRNPERTRAWLRLAPQKGLPVTRFSVVSLAALTKLHATFTAEELASVECLFMNRESTLVKSNSGRFRERASRDAELMKDEVGKLLPRGEAPVEDLLQVGPSSIACVSGFLFNLVERTVKLITPCKATDRWPLGYMVLAEGSFDTAETLRERLHEMIDDRMTVDIEEQNQVGFREDLKYRRQDGGFRVWTCHGGTQFVSDDRGTYYADLGDMIAAGCHSPQEIADRLLASHGTFPGDTLGALDAMLKKGLLQESP